MFASAFCTGGTNRRAMEGLSAGERPSGRNDPLGKSDRTAPCGLARSFNGPAESASPGIKDRWDYGLPEAFDSLAFFGELGLDSIER